MPTRPADYYLSWNGVTQGVPKKWTCWHCGCETGNDRVIVGQEYSPQGGSGSFDWIYFCPLCSYPTYFEKDGATYPGSVYGDKLSHLPDIVERVYDQARHVMSVSGYEAAAMLCRKLIMHIAVEKDAKEGATFASYVDHLVTNGYVPAATKDYVAHIKDLGNEANHQIRAFSRGEAEEMISFLEMLCRSVYEYPEKLMRKQEQPMAPTP